MPETDLRAAFIAGLRELADHFEDTPDLPLPFEVEHQDPAIGTFTFHAQAADEYTAAVRALGGRRQKGTAGGGRLAATTRTFGPGVVFRVFVPRGEVCERRVVDTITKAVTAVSCVHCDEPIKAWGAPDQWWHIDPETGDHAFLNCGTHIDDDGNEIGGQPASPPDFTAVSIDTTEVVEWVCKPVLGAEADT